MRSNSPPEGLTFASRSGRVHGTIRSLHKMCKLWIHTHRAADLHLTVLDVDGERRRKALSTLPAEHAKDLLFGADCSTRVLAFWRARRITGGVTHRRRCCCSGGAIRRQTRLATIWIQEIESVGSGLGWRWCDRVWDV